MDQFEKYLGLTYRYLGIRNRSEKEIRDYLEKKKTSPEVTEKIIKKLYEYKFLNDEAFARAWVRSRAKFKPRAKRVLEMELKQKGIEKDLIEKILNEEDGDIPDEVTQAKQLIIKRVKKLKGVPRQEIYQKVGAFLSRKGYGWDVIKRAIDDSLKDNV